MRGPNVFLGYYKEPEATARGARRRLAVLGRPRRSSTRDGFLTITGRKKEIIITAGGKNIAPKNIEAALKHSPLVGEAVVIGDRRKYLTALVTLDDEAARNYLGEQASPTASPATTTRRSRAEIQSAIDEVNQELARVEQVKKFAILAAPLRASTPASSRRR